jgi:hypothetical protein
MHGRPGRPAVMFGRRCGRPFSAETVLRPRQLTLLDLQGEYIGGDRAGARSQVGRHRIGLPVWVQRGLPPERDQQREQGVSTLLGSGWGGTYGSPWVSSGPWRRGDTAFLRGPSRTHLEALVAAPRGQIPRRLRAGLHTPGGASMRKLKLGSIVGMSSEPGDHTEGEESRPADAPACGPVATTAMRQQRLKKAALNSVEVSTVWAGLPRAAVWAGEDPRR